MKLVYLDHAATTPVHPEVVEAMSPYFQERFGNPSSLHQAGQIVRQSVESARARIAEYLGCESKEIIFTSGGTEADNLAIFGVAYANRARGNHIITSSIEHHAVFNTCRQLGKEGFQVTYLPVDKYGIVELAQLEKAIRKETILISIMYGNNVTGSLQPIEAIGQIAQEHKILFHTDAIQAVGKVKIDLSKLPVDLLAFSGHKIYGPKGIGGLYIRHGAKIKSLQYGGGHEFGRRAGTENVPGIVGLAKAIGLSQRYMDEWMGRIRSLRDRLEQGITGQIQEVQINGHPSQRLPHLLNVSFHFVEGESIILNLDTYGICVSSASACVSESLEPSHVLMAMGIPPQIVHGSIRFSLGKDNTQKDIDFTIECLAKIIKKLREMSPLYRKKTS